MTISPTAGGNSEHFHASLNDSRCGMEPELHAMAGRPNRIKLIHPDLPGQPQMDFDPQRLLHELHAQQIELQLQNKELQRVQTELEASRILYRDLYDLAPIGYCTLDENGLILQANRTAARMLGEAREELAGQAFCRFIAIDDQEALNRHRQQLDSTDGLHSCDLCMVKKTGTTFWARLNSLRELCTADKPVYRITFGDISESKCMEEALREQEAFFHLIAENLSDFVAVLDREGRRLYNSPSYEQFFGCLSDLYGTNSFAEIHPDDRERVKQVFMETVRSGQGRQLDYRFVLADGSIREMESRGSVIRDKDGQVARVVVVSHDITERKRLEEQVRQMAFHDSLTQLPNRRLLGDRLSQATAASARNAMHGALVFIDLDNFKQLNDLHGHELGDLLLIEVAARLKHGVREIDTVARFGGDEFVVLLGHLDTDETESIAQAGVIAEKLRTALAETYRLGEADDAVSHRCTASIGVTLFKHQEASQAGILKRADRAMYKAKQGGGNQVRFCRLQDS